MAGYKTKISGNLVDGLEIRGIKEKRWIHLPTTHTHPAIPNTSDEVASPEVVRKHDEARKFAHFFPPIDPNIEVLILVGNNCGEAMFTKCFGLNFPYVHHTSLGWALVGPVCCDSKGKGYSSELKCMRTSLSSTCEHFSSEGTFVNPVGKDIFPKSFDVFKESSDDDHLCISRDDESFLDILSEGTQVNEKGNLQIPLPFKKESWLPDNKVAVYQRTRNSLSRIRRDPSKVDKCVQTMQKYIDGGHVEPVNGKSANKQLLNYIPVFPVTHPKKDKLRLVFDSSATYSGRSLNDNLLRGPDEANRIVGVLLRFRHGEVGFAADVECMFHAFYVPPEQRDAMRFFWWNENKPSESLSEYRANVHVFGNRCSPAIATYGLRFTTTHPDAKEKSEAVSFIKNNFYVDDGMGSSSTCEEAIKILQDARSILSRFNIRLHKVVATRKEVLDALPNTELATGIDCIDLSKSSLQGALGITWKISSDTFSLRCQVPQREFTKRGVLSINGSLYDPLGMASPVALTGRLLQRKFMPPETRDSEYHRYEWDDRLPSEFLSEWESWMETLSDVGNISLPRCFHPPGFIPICTQMHVFADASKDAIGFVIYLRQYDIDGKCSTAFAFANSKVAPRSATSIPRLELCAAVEAALSAVYIRRELGHTVDDVTFYSDSNATLGYIRNCERRFSKYVTARVKVILNCSTAGQWNYIPTQLNPADIATRPHTPSELLKSRWFEGPEFLMKENLSFENQCDNLSDLPETITEVKTLKTEVVLEDYLLRTLYERNSSWFRTVRVLTSIFRFKTSFQRFNSPTEELSVMAVNFLVREAQKDKFSSSYQKIIHGNKLDENDCLSGLSPFVDSNQIIRVGGRLRHLDRPFPEKHPILLPADHPLTVLILRHYHEKTCHQGRHLTVSAVRTAGFHIHKRRSVVSKFLSGCVICKKLRGSFQSQMMANLPPDRLEQCPPFASTGIDVFGPYSVHDGKSTRRNLGSKKMWVLLCTCLYSRAIHLEPLSSLETTTFRLALRRFFALRGNCTRIRSDHGTNFIGAKNQMEMDVDITSIKQEALKSGCTWELTPPAASHFAGVWERKVGSVKRVLDGSMLQSKNSILSRDELCTLLQEAACIVNNTPLSEVSNDFLDPFPLSPASILTLRENPNPPPPGAFSQDDLLQYGKRRWRRIQFLADEFWKRWRANFISNLQQRNKWKFPKTNLKINDVVLIKDKGPRNSWPIGRVSEVKFSEDNLVRSVTLQLRPTAKGSARILERSIHDLVLLVPS